MEGAGGIRRNRAYMEQIKAQVQQQSDDGWVWGNHRGGGGAPVKDTDGNTVTNFKGRIANNNSGQKRDWSPPLQQEKPKPPRGGRRLRELEEEEEEHYQEDGFAPRGHPGRQARQGRQQQPPPQQQQQQQQKVVVAGKMNRAFHEDDSIPGLVDHVQPSNPSPASSPKKFMSAIQEMNSSVTPQEKQAKAKRELEYQNALRRQIEEKQREKEEHKLKEDEIKRREYEEFMQHFQPGFKITTDKRNQPAFKESRQGVREALSTAEMPKRKRNGGDNGADIPGLDFEFQEGSDEEDSRRGRKGGKLAFGQDMPPHNRRQRSDHGQEDDNYGGGGGGGGRRRNREKQAARRRGNFDQVEDEEGGAEVEDYPPRQTSPRRLQPRQQQQQQRWTNEEEEFVSVEKYDELSALCDKLMRQQGDLQAEIHQQASIIKELQKGKTAAGSGGLTPGAPAVRSKSVQQPRSIAAFEGRSSSIERRRAAAAAGADAEDRSRPSVKQRPASMHAAPVGRGGGRERSVDRVINELPFKKNAADAKKAAKVAFGSSIINSDGKKPLNAPTTVVVAAAASGAAGKAGPKAIKSTGDLLAHKRNVSDREGGVNGFAKLQLRNGGGVGGGGGAPRIVSYEDDEQTEIMVDRGGRDGRGAGAGALQGSINLELRGQSRYIKIGNDDTSGDQLDKLLARANRSHYH